MGCLRIRGKDHSIMRRDNGAKKMDTRVKCSMVVDAYSEKSSFLA